MHERHRFGHHHVCVRCNWPARKSNRRRNDNKLSVCRRRSAARKAGHFDNCDLYLYGNLLIRKDGETLLYDGLGTARAETNSSQAVTFTLTPDAFGNVVTTTGSTGSSYGFAATSGYRSDGDAGLMKVGCRYYDAQIGSYITRDSYLDQKPYLYCEHAPVNATDPSGHMIFSVSIGFVGGILFFGGWGNIGLGIDDNGNVGIIGNLGGGLGGGGSLGLGGGIGFGSIGDGDSGGIGGAGFGGFLAGGNVSVGAGKGGLDLNGGTAEMGPTVGGGFVGINHSHTWKLIGPATSILILAIMPKLM